MLNSKRTLKTKVSFAWKKDYRISSNYKCHDVDQGHSKKLL